ncbi:secreted protein [gut metagenome]|uniref:Secreted protein n=1 Tax=gut metagenome TaxID=749906 RepID=J9FUK0_9ZZZZ
MTRFNLVSKILASSLSVLSISVLIFAKSSSIFCFPPNLTIYRLPLFTL